MQGLIGHTGFVGSNLKEQMHFDETYNSKNIQDIQGKTFGLLVISGVSAVKWLANKEPEKDWENIQSLCDMLKKVKAKRVIVISTVDVYDPPKNVDETTLILPDNIHPYGKHRFVFEEFVKSLFPTKIIRLPGLFGRNLKKNIIYDYLNNNQVEKIDTRNIFQFYNLDWLGHDLKKLIASDISLLNMATEPISALEVSGICLGEERPNALDITPVEYCVKSVHSAAFRGGNGFLYTKEEVLESLKAFVDHYKALK